MAVEALKFIGDAMLAIFALVDGADRAEIAARAHGVGGGQ